MDLLKVRRRLFRSLLLRRLRPPPLFQSSLLIFVTRPLAVSATGRRPSDSSAPRRPPSHRSGKASIFSFKANFAGKGRGGKKGLHTYHVSLLRTLDQLVSSFHADLGPQAVGRGGGGRRRDHMWPPPPIPALPAGDGGWVRPRPSLRFEDAGGRVSSLLSHLAIRGRTLLSRLATAKSDSFRVEKNNTFYSRNCILDPLPTFSPSCVHPLPRR